MFDLVPFAGSGREVAHGDGEVGLVGQPLQFDLPQPEAGPVTAAAIRCDQQSPRTRIFFFAHRMPPPPYRLHSECGRVVIDSHLTHPVFAARS